MQNILQSFEPSVQRRKALLFSLVVMAYMAIYAWMGSSGDASATDIQQIDGETWLVIQGVLSGVFFVLLPMLFLQHGLDFPVQKLIRRLDLRTVFYVLGLAICGLVVLSVVVEWNAEIEFSNGQFQQWARAKEDQLKVLTEHVLNIQSFGHFALALLVVAVFAAVGEEVFFRGIMQNLLGSWTGNKHVAIWVTAVVFSAIHLQFFGFFPRLLLGAFFGYLYLYSGNLTVPILGHFFHNALGVTALYAANLQPGGLSVDPDQMDKAAPWPMVGLFLVIGVFLFRHFIRQQHVERSV